ncbi:MAG TPA: D-ribose pyranase [Candidatus Paceibacterota bacterium]|nr:D-ribose pyranase [Candidatus Paceibacterota bacterium]
MKKTGILNRDIAALVAAMGHYDRLVVTDAGFPIPKGVPCIDLTMGANMPTVLEVLNMLALELEVEQFYFANEVLPSPDSRSAEIQKIFPRAKSFPVPHLEFKKLALEARGIVRTGDFHAYGNVLLASGVAY